jgi:hypothetical protein
VHLHPVARARLVGRIHDVMGQRGIEMPQLVTRSRLPRQTVKDVLDGVTKDPTIGVLIHLVHGLELRSVEELIGPLGTSELRRIEFGNDVVV